MLKPICSVSVIEKNMQKAVLVFVVFVLLNEVTPKLPVRKDFLTNKKAAMSKQLGPHVPRWEELARYTKDLKISQDKTLINFKVPPKEINIPGTRNLQQNTTTDFLAKTETKNVTREIIATVKPEANITVSKIPKKYSANETIGARLAILKQNMTRETEKPKFVEVIAPTMIPIFRPMQSNPRAVQPISNELIRKEMDTKNELNSQNIISPNDLNLNATNPKQHFNNLHSNALNNLQTNIDSGENTHRAYNNLIEQNILNQMQNMIQHKIDHRKAKENTVNNDSNSSYQANAQTNEWRDINNLLVPSDTSKLNYQEITLNLNEVQSTNSVQTIPHNSQSLHQIPKTEELIAQEFYIPNDIIQNINNPTNNHLSSKILNNNAFINSNGLHKPILDENGLSSDNLNVDQNGFNKFIQQSVVPNGMQYDLKIDPPLPRHFIPGNSHTIPTGYNIIPNGLNIQSQLHTTDPNADHFVYNDFNKNILSNNVRTVPDHEMTSQNAGTVQPETNPMPRTTGFNIPYLKAADVLEDFAAKPCSQQNQPKVNSVTENPIVNLQCEKPLLNAEEIEDSVAIVFKPKNISLLKFYGDLLKKITLTVLVPYHISKLTT